MARLKDESSDSVLTDYIIAIFKAWGRDFFTCELCKEKLPQPGELHHTKYIGCTIYDILIVCHRCNLQPVNTGLA